MLELPFEISLPDFMLEIFIKMSYNVKLYMYVELLHTVRKDWYHENAERERAHSSDE